MGDWADEMTKAMHEDPDQFGMVLDQEGYAVDRPRDHAPSVAAPASLREALEAVAPFIEQMGHLTSPRCHELMPADGTCSCGRRKVQELVRAALRAESVAAPSVDPKLLAVVLHQAGVCVQPEIPGFERKHAWDHEQAAKTILTMLGAAAPPALDAATASKLERLEAVESGREMPRYMIRNRDAVHVPIRYEPDDTAATPSGERAAREKKP